ncbi:Murein DD-endopeptidase MepM and murein hydrolase activator NlpD, contain LysM domain [Cribrihabitans marinus]|uniref:Murein DD-endopeptidase MepM and murein hydrolase activator NlpD, contain LysM domain n=1 Tax=Cribrihabitans marinus TaxID=1227549 RepID=A0A1H6RH12_9RHOB|nr:peptidoglycan DD-metalloendopeptidase family protein [Cribrihabitans marinus]GGH20524.1 peptidase M23 [Cribrihabitans marinus]SEI51130.1 Murein DD-endopeptidase MepM and murein hydrolase activator NlpD, contain LysM domain [Cribrihabitans marinus]
MNEFFGTPRMLRRAAVLSAVALLAGCEEPLDYDLRGQLGAFSTAPAAQGAATAPRPAPDERGVISYPNYQVAVARRGDSVTELATRVGLPAGEVARFNGLNPDDRLRDGEVLALPRRVSEPAGAPGNVDIATLAGDAIDRSPDTPSVQTSTLEPAQPAAATPSGPEPVRHKVARGETAYTISRLYQVPVKSLGEWNGLGPDLAVREGQYLIIPVNNQPAPNRAVPVAGGTAVTQPGAGSPTPTPPSATQPLPEEKVAVEAPEPPEIPVAAPTATSNAALAFPVSGKIIRTYEKGKSEGIDIAASPGAPVTAAEDGTVAAITADADEVPIIVLRHKDNLLTVYANVDAIEVNKGDRVKRGQKLAKLRSGDDAYVHFEVRKGFDSVDPEPYLK